MVHAGGFVGGHTREKERICHDHDPVPAFVGLHRILGSGPIRPRYVVAYETMLRPATVSRLSVPEHYTRGALELVLDGG